MPIFPPVLIKYREFPSVDSLCSDLSTLGDVSDDDDDDDNLLLYVPTLHQLEMKQDSDHLTTTTRRRRLAACCKGIEDDQFIISVDHDEEDMLSDVREEEDDDKRVRKEEEYYRLFWGDNCFHKLRNSSSSSSNIDVKGRNNSTDEVYENKLSLCCRATEDEEGVESCGGGDGAEEEQNLDFCYTNYYEVDGRGCDCTGRARIGW